MPTRRTAELIFFLRRPFSPAMQQKGDTSIFKACTIQFEPVLSYSGRARCPTIKIVRYVAQLSTG